MSVREWLAGKEILLTGVTSDIGNVVLEKLLRSCPNIKTIYVVLRSKNSLIKEKRVEKIFESNGFRRLKQEFPNAISRIRMLEGNLVYDNLGLSEEHVALLNSVSIVIHAGGPCESVLELCSELPALRVASIASDIFKQRGRITESLQHEKMPKIPLALVRLPAIGPALKEPMPGYVTVLRGSIALMVGAGYALGNPDFPAAIVPVDVAANTLITAAWDKEIRTKTQEVTIYNVPALDCTWRTLIKNGSRASKNFSYPSFGIRGMTSHPWIYWLVVLLLEWLPSVLCDAFLFAVGGKPSVVEDHLHVQSLLQSLQPVLSRSWTSDQKNVFELHNHLTPEDKEDFFIRPDIDLETYVLCAAAAVKKMSVNKKNEKIMTNFKRLLFVAVALVLVFVIFM